MAKQKKTKRPLTEAQKRNLKPFKKGQSGNPAGRPKTKLPKLEDVLIKVLGVNDDSETSEIEEMVKSLVKQARDRKDRNSVKAAQMLIDRAYGKAPMIVQGPDGNDGKPQPIFGFNIKLKKDA